MRKYFERIMSFLNKRNQNHFSGDVTALLRQWANGEPDAISRLVEALYPELKRMAERRMRNERADHTLQATGLVHEFFLEMARNQEMVWQNRAHFLAVASQAMRRFLIDYARGHNADRRGGKVTKLQLDGLDLAALDAESRDTVNLVIMGELLDRLAAEEPRMAQVVDMRCFGGLTYTEIGEVLRIDERTAKRDWQVARAWLSSQLWREYGK
jgi:RNA polymerase sigma factor (TIGR02999 family)